MGRKLRKAEREARDATQTTGEDMTQASDADEETPPVERVMRREIDEVQTMENPTSAMSGPAKVWDQYAASALQAISAVVAREIQHYSRPQNVQQIAACAAAIADAMMAERAKRL